MAPRYQISHVNCKMGIPESIRPNAHVVERVWNKDGVEVSVNGNTVTVEYPDGKIEVPKSQCLVVYKRAIKAKKPAPALTPMELANQAIEEMGK